MSADASLHRRSIGRLLFYVLLAAAFAMHAGWISAALIDDAYIALRYAKNFARGEGLVFLPGERVEGYTSFSWVMIAALFVKVGVNPAGIMPLVGIAVGAALVIFVARSGQVLAESEGRPHPLAGAPAALFVGATPSLAFYSGTGLETSLAALLQTMAAVYALQRRSLAFAIAAGLALLTRPEAALVVMIGTGWFVWIGRTDGNRNARRLLPAALVLLAVIVSFAIFKRVYFGRLLPNTFTAKTPNLENGISYAAWCLPPLVGFILAAAMDVRRRGLLFVVWAASFAGIALEGGDWMAGSRMAVPSIATLALAADRALLDLGRPWRRPKNGLLALAWGATAFGLVLSAREALNLRLTGLVADVQNVARRDLALRMWDEGVRSIGTLDIGLPGYVEPRFVFLDLGGLTDATLARAPGGYNDKKLPMDYVASHAPDAFLFTARRRLEVHQDGSFELDGWYPVETNLASTRWFHDHYRPHEGVAIQPDVHLVWFARVPAR